MSSGSPGMLSAGFSLTRRLLRCEALLPGTGLALCSHAQAHPLLCLVTSQLLPVLPIQMEMRMTHRHPNGRWPANTDPPA